MKELSSKQSIGGTSKKPRWAAVSMLVPCLAVVTGCSGESFDDAEESVATNQAPLDVSKFHGWEQIPPGIFNAGPAIARMDDVTKFSCGRGTDNLIWCNSWLDFPDDNNPPVWSPYTPISNIQMASRPSLAWYIDQNGEKQWIVVALRSNGAIMFNAHQGPGHGSWRGFTQLGTTTGFTDYASVVSTGHDLYVFAAKIDTSTAPNNYMRYYYTRGFITQGVPTFNQGWTELPGGGLFRGAPQGVVSPSGGRWTVAGQGSDLRYWVATGASPAAFRGWRPLGTMKYETTPALTARSENEVDTYGTQVNKDTFCVSTFNPTVPPSAVACNVIGTGLFKSPAAAYGHATSLDVVGLGLDNTFYMNRWF